MLRYRLVHALPTSTGPSLPPGNYVNEASFAHDSYGDYVVVLEIGADNGDVNSLAAGVLAADGYQIKFAGSRGFMAPQ